MCGMPICSTWISLKNESIDPRLCGGCRLRLSVDLKSLVVLHKECESVLQHRPEPVERVRGWWPGWMALNEAAVTVRSEILEVVASWCELVVSERHAPAPSTLELGTLAAFLRRHLGWLTAHTAAADFAAEISELTVKAQDVISPDRRITIELGTCANPDCDEAVRVAVHPSHRQMGEVQCGKGHSYRPREWLSLNSRPSSGSLGRSRTVPGDLAALAAGVSEVTIRVWANRGKLTRHRKGGRIEYDLLEVAALSRGG